MSESSSSELPALLGADDPAPYETLNHDARNPILLLCDHASRAIPRALDNLGLAPELTERHIGWDIGAARVTRRLAEQLGSPAVLSGYSRLLIDYNRPPGSPESILPVSDGVFVPGNQNLTEEQAQQRLETFFEPYHAAINQTLAQLWRHGPTPALVSIHSFTPRMHDGEPRPWQVGVLWNHDPRLALPMIDWFETELDLCVGNNEPYSGRAVGYTMQTHAESAGLPHVLLEIRQDLIATDHDCDRWADYIAQALDSVLADPSIHCVKHY